MAFIQNSGAQGFFQLYDTLGGGLNRATIFALGIMPYISASIIFQLAGGVASIGKMQKDEEGRKKLTQWTRYMTIFIALSQAYTFTLFTESIPGAMIHPGFASRLTMVFTLTAGAIFVMWLGEQITERGIGNGMSLLITLSILERLWPAAINMIRSVKDHVISGGGALLLVVLAIGAIAAVVAMTIAARRIPIQIPRKVMGRGRIREGQKTFIPIRLITAGVMPIIFAQTIIIVPGTLANFTKNPVLTDIAATFAPGTFWYSLTFGIMVVLFSYFYTSIIFNSVDLAENLKKQGGFIPGVKPGRRHRRLHRLGPLPGHAAGRALPGRHRDHPDRGGPEGRLPGGLRRHLGPDRRRRAARHHRAGRAAPHAAQVRRLHEDRAGEVPGAAAALHVTAGAGSGERGAGSGEISPAPCSPLTPSFNVEGRMDILLLGPPGAGKGTQGAMLAKRLGLPKIATGDLLREAVANATPLGKEAKAVMESGALVSDDLIMRIVRDELNRPSAARGVVFDGVVRTIPQAEGIEKILKDLGRKMDKVLFFDVTDAEILGRLEKRRGIEGRADDDPKAVARRLTAYREQTAPVLDWYRKRGGVAKIAAVGSVEDIAARVKAELGV